MHIVSSDTRIFYVQQCFNSKRYDFDGNMVMLMAMMMLVVVLQPSPCAPTFNFHIIYIAISIVIFKCVVDVVCLPVLSTNCHKILDLYKSEQGPFTSAPPLRPAPPLSLSLPFLSQYFSFVSNSILFFIQVWPNA